MLLVPIAAFPQVARTPQIQTERDLVAVLVSGPITGPATSAVLRDHGNLVTKTLFDQLMAQAYLLSSQDPRKAELIYEMARVVAEQMGNKKLVAFSFYETGRLHFERGKISLAKLNYLKSKETLELDGPSSDLVVVLSTLGNVCLYKDALKEAKEYSQQSIAMANSVQASDKPLLGLIEYGVAVSWLNLGDLAKREGHYDEALTYFQKALESFKGLIDIRPQYAADVADSLAEIGRVYRVKGEHLAALRYFNQALEIAKALKLKDKLAGVLNSISVLYLEQNDYLKASEYANQSLSVYKELGDRYEIARLLANQGVINQRQGKYADALKSFQESLQNSDDVDTPDLVIAAQEGIGAVYQEQGDYRAALEWLNRAAVMAQRLGNQTRQAELLWRLGEAHYLKGDLPMAIASSTSAAELAGQLRLPIISYLALTARGKYHLAENNYHLAFQTLSQAIEQVELLRDKVAGQEQGRQIFFDNKVASYNLLVELFIKQNKPAEALLYAERAKGRVLLDVVHGGKVDLAKTLTPSEKEEAHRLNRTILGLNEQLSSEESKTRSDPNVLNQLYEKRDRARIEYESYQNALFAAHPDLNVRRGRTTPLTLKDITTLTRGNETAYVEYVVSKERVYLFALTGGGSSDGPEVRVYPLTVKPDELAAKVEQFHQRIANRHPDFASIARELYATLIEPANQQLRGSNTVCIVPDSFLWNLPFQALITGSNQYLIEDHKLYYVPSLTVLREMNKERAGKGRRVASLLAFGNPIIGKNNQRDEELCPLPEAEAEVASVAKTFGPHVNKVLIGREASEKTFRALAPTFATIHLATHGVIDNRHPLYSHLLLTKTKGDLENDGLLEAREIMNMNLDADLAVLSACETANGRIAPGEGVMGTSWAFFVAGTRSMLVSQWKVNSASTSQLMTNFYQALESKQNPEDGKKGRSLQEATLRLMQDDRYRHPFYWAGFVLIGSN
jgi:CHAT domain-containing protein/Tfp pilus assembly protein PilF